MADRNITSFPIPANYISAAKVPYDNTGSGLSSTDVQGALNELGIFKNSIGKEVTNGSLVNGHNYIVQFMLTNGTYRRFHVAWHATTSMTRLFVGDVTNGRMGFYVIAVKYLNKSLSIEEVWRTEITSTGVIYAPTQDNTAAVVEHMWDLGSSN